MATPFDLLEDRTRTLLNVALTEYEQLLATEKQKSLDLVCFIGAREYRVQSVGRFPPGLLWISTVKHDGTAFQIFAPVEQVAFAVVVSDRRPETPNRMISFKESNPSTIGDANR